MIKYLGKTFDDRHGGPFDRGSADSWYGRGKVPHYFEGATYQSRKFEIHEMTEDEVVAYLAGYEYNEEFDDKKDWGR